MNETFLFLLLAAVCLLIGAFVGNLFARLKNKSESGKLEERLSQAAVQEEKLNTLIATISNEREGIRKEKDFLNVELTRRNSDLENLEVKLREQKMEVEKLQEKFSETFENSFMLFFQKWLKNRLFLNFLLSKPRIFFLTP